MLSSTGGSPARSAVMPAERERDEMERNEPGVVPVESSDTRRPSPPYGWIAVALITVVVVCVLALLFLGGQVEARFGPIGNSV